MSWRGSRATGVGLLLFAWGMGSSACVNGSVPAELGPDAGIDSVFIRGGIAAPHSGVVQLTRYGSQSYCTGFLLNSTVVVTAAHCVPDDASGATGLFFIWNYRTSSSNPDLIWADDAHFARNPNYAGDAEYDVGIIYLDQDQWPETGYRDYLRIYQDDGDRVGQLRVWGRGYSTYSGAGADTLRYGDFAVYGWPFSPTHTLLHTEATDTLEVCKGDSGGPDIKFAGLELVAGVNSQITDPLTGSERCSASWGGAVHARINQEVLAWIGQETGSQCDPLSTQGFAYARCFSIPFVNDVSGEGLDRGLATAIVNVIM